MRGKRAKWIRSLLDQVAESNPLALDKKLRRRAKKEYNLARRTDYGRKNLTR